MYHGYVSMRQYDFNFVQNKILSDINNQSWPPVKLYAGTLNRPEIKNAMPSVYSTGICIRFDYLTEIDTIWNYSNKFSSHLLNHSSLHVYYTVLVMRE